MSKKIWLAGLMAVALAGTALTASADDSQAPAGDNDQPGMGQGMCGGMMGGGRLEKMKEKLGLADGQVSQLKGLFKSQGKTMKPLRDQLKIDMDTLQQKVDQKASDGDLRKLLDKLDAESREMQAGREKMKAQLRSILTPTQQAKFVLGMRGKGMQMMKKWREHRKEKGGSSN